MKMLSIFSVITLLAISTVANAWWNNNDNRSNWRNQYDGNSYGSGDTSDDGRMGFKGDFHFRWKMRGKGDGYNYGYWGNNLNNRHNSGWYDNGRYYNGYRNNSTRRPGGYYPNRGHRPYQRAVAPPQSFNQR